MSFSKLRNGVTLIEILVTLSLFFVALGIMGKLFGYGVRMNTQSEERNGLQNSRLRVLARLERALANSSRSGNTAFYLTSPTEGDLVLSLISTASWDDVEQRPIFSSYDVFYQSSSEDSLRHLSIPLTTTAVAIPLTETELRDAINNEPSTALLEDLTAFHLCLPSDGSISATLTNPLGLRLTQTTSRGTSLETELTYKNVRP